MAEEKKAKKKNLVKLACSVCSRINYRTSKSKNAAQLQKTLNLKKYCKICRKRTVHKEVK